MKLVLSDRTFSSTNHHFEMVYNQENSVLQKQQHAEAKME